MMMRRISTALLLLLCLGAPALAANPVPLINNPLVPASVAPGSDGFTLTVNGGGFVSGAAVNWNGAPLATTFVSNSKLTAAVPAADVANAGSAEITVTNPGVGARSDMLQFLIAAPEPGVFLANAPNSPFGEDLWVNGLWDFTGSGRLDVTTLFVPPIGAQYGILGLGNGDGTFSPASPTLPQGVGWGPIGDFNGDGVLDVVGGSPLQLLSGNGNGTFTAGPTITLPAGCHLAPEATWVGRGKDDFGVEARDINADGELDLLLQCGASPPYSVQELLGDGDGTFSSPGPATALPSGFAPIGLWDFNGDGKLDLLTADEQCPDAANATFQVMLGNGDGTFTLPPSAPVNVGTAGCSIAVADFNGDGKLDLAVPNGGDGAGTILNTRPIAILLGNGDGTFTPVPNCCGVPGQEGYNIVSGDFSNHGKPDLAVMIRGQMGLVNGFRAPQPPQGPFYPEVYLEKGDGTFALSNFSMMLPSYTLEATGMYTGDVSSDGKLDLVGGLREPANNQIYVLLQTPPPAQLPDFTIAPASATVSVKAGATATDNINIASINGYIASGVSLTFAGCPASATCNVTQPQGMIIPASSGSFPVTITTQACSTSGAAPLGKLPAPPSPASRLLLVLGLVLAALVAADYARRRLRGRRGSPLLFLLPLIATFAVVGCGGPPASITNPPPCVGGTPPGTYTLTVTAVSGSISHSSQLTLTVQ